MEKDKLAGKVVVITGASSGAGRAAALAFAANGADLVLAGRNRKALQETAERCRSAGVRALDIVTDVTDAEAVARLATEAEEWQGKIDVWINNAGVLAAGTFEETPIAVHHRVVNTNLLGYMNGAHAVLPCFKRQGHGILINNISVGGFLPVPYGAGYSASKFGLRGFSEALRGELVDWPAIRVCDLFPGFLNTPGIEHAANYTGRLLKPAPPVSDVSTLAKAMVKLAVRPRNEQFPGISPRLFQVAHALFPGKVTRVTGSVMKKYFRRAHEAPETNGNLFGPVDASMAERGKRKARSKRPYIVLGVMAGLALGAFFRIRSIEKV
jgi:short-subunit dehydrogenase